MPIRLRWGALAIATCGLVAAAAAGAILWAPWQSDGEGQSVGGASTAFCEKLAAWHAAQQEFLAHSVDPEFREGARFLATADLYDRAAKTALPDGASDGERKAIGVFREMMAAEGRWLSDLRFRNIVTSPGANVDPASQEEARQKVEEARLNLNDVVERANVLLQQLCGLSALPVSEPASQ